MEGVQLALHTLHHSSAYRSELVQVIRTLIVWLDGSKAAPFFCVFVSSEILPKLIMTFS
jgi:hypothetical protein